MKYIKRRFKKHDTRFITNFPHTISIEPMEISHFMESVRLSKINASVFDWCNNNYGKSFREWAYGTTGGLVFYFKCLEDAMAFKIRWSGIV